MRGLFAAILLLASHAQAETVAFGDALQAKFHHERCLSCHQFNSAKNNGRAFSTHRSRYLCSQCHTPAVNGLKPGEWLAPEARFDYTGLSAKATCQFMKRNMNNDDAKLIDHLLHDVRIRWALESGMAPGRQKPKVPGGYSEWERDVNAWVSGGMRCD
jgi:mono/diheme cytochrome c family protein